MKLKEFGPQGSERAYKILLCRSATECKFLRKWSCDMRASSFKLNSWIQIKKTKIQGNCVEEVGYIKTFCRDKKIASVSVSVWVWVFLIIYLLNYESFILEVWRFIIQQVNNNATSLHHWIKNQPFSHKKLAKLRISSICTQKCCWIKNRQTSKCCRFIISQITQTQTETETEAVRSHILSLELPCFRPELFRADCNDRISLQFLGCIFVCQRDLSAYYIAMALLVGLSQYHFLSYISVLINKGWLISYIVL